MAPTPLLRWFSYVARISQIRALVFHEPTNHSAQFHELCSDPQLRKVDPDCRQYCDCTSCLRNAGTLSLQPIKLCLNALSKESSEMTLMWWIEAEGTYFRSIDLAISWSKLKKRTHIKARLTLNGIVFARFHDYCSSDRKMDTGR